MEDLFLTRSGDFLHSEYEMFQEAVRKVGSVWLHSFECSQTRQTEWDDICPQRNLGATIVLRISRFAMEILPHSEEDYAKWLAVLTKELGDGGDDHHAIVWDLRQMQIQESW